MSSTPFPEGAPDAVKLPGLATMQRFAKTLGYDFTNDELEHRRRTARANGVPEPSLHGAARPHSAAEGTYM